MRKPFFKSILIPLIGIAMFITATRCTQEPQLGQKSVKKVVAAMTLEEKAYFVTGSRRGFGPFGAADTTAQDSLPVVSNSNLVPGAAGTTYAIPRLGITSMVLADGPAGLRISPNREDDEETYYCTAFPVGTLLASTWDTELVYSVGQAMGNEVLEYGVDIILGPGMNIHRNPLCGRNFEYYSEDPLVSGKMAAAMVSGIQSQGVGATLKHFVANNAETNRTGVNTIVGQRALREIYLEGFRIAAQEAKPWAVMSSYNLVNGVYTPESPDLLTSILRQDWGYEGFVMTDWGGGRDDVAKVAAGNDLIMPSGQPDTIIEAVQAGNLDEALLDRDVSKILGIAVETPRFKGYEYSNKPDLEGHAEVTRQAATEGMVLLKNDGSALPLSEGIGNIAAFGNTSYQIITGGTGSGDVNEAYSVSLVQGLEDVGYTVNEALEDAYNTYLETSLEEWQAEMEERTGGAFGGFGFRGQPVFGEMDVSSDLLNQIAEGADAALITIGRNSGEGRDREVEGDFDLTQVEKDLISNVTSAFHAQGKKVIVILNIGGVIETASWRDVPDAILLAWQAGQETGNSIADIISGNVNPSGKLASTFPMKYQDVPSADNFPGEYTDPEPPQPEPGSPFGFGRMRRSSRVVYEEGIYVGYRYYGTFGVETAYPFGYGLSYTTFDYGSASLSSEQFKDEITVTVDVSNTGDVAGKEVVELYISAPAENMDKPVKELKGFAKTQLLQPGETETVSFTIDSRNLASYDASTSSWVAEAGTYEVQIGASSEDIRQTASFDLDGEIVVKTTTNSLAPPEAIDELKPGS